MALLPGDDGPYVFESPVPAEGTGRTLLGYLSTRFTYRDEHSWRERIAGGDVSLGGEESREPERILVAGESLACVHRDYAEPPVPTDWRIVAMGEDWLAVGKPSGMPVHSTPRIYRQTLVWQVRKLLGEGWTPAHRLDRDTSGLVVFSRGDRLPRWLGRAFSRNAAKKEYLALVLGTLTESVEIDQPISLAGDPEIPLRRRAGNGGKEASTLLVPLGADRGGCGTWVVAQPREGRTHQIRVHCEAAGHPIVGDLLYDGKGGEGYLRRIQGTPGLPGLAESPRLHLHAWTLCFADPPPGTLPRELRCPPPGEWEILGLDDAKGDGSVSASNPPRTSSAGEVFSVLEQRVVRDDDQDGVHCDAEVIKKLINPRLGQPGYVGAMTKELVAAAYGDRDTRVRLCSLAYQFQSEWSVDWEKALRKFDPDVAKIQGPMFNLYRFWPDAVSAGCDLPQDGKVYHYHPAAFKLVAYDQPTKAAKVSVAKKSSGALGDGIPLVWGQKVSKEFRDKVKTISAAIRIDPNFLMACMAYESGLDPSIQNKSTDATGLIQFMPSTAKSLGTTIDDLKSMDGTAQLDYVKKYFAPYTGKIATIEDIYMVILWPQAVGKPLDYILFSDGTKAYDQNAGLDADSDGKITKREAAARVRKKFEEGKKWMA